MRKFKLLKDTYDGMKAGDEINQYFATSKGYLYRVLTGNCKGGLISYFDVENNPEWFSEIKEEEDVMGGIEKQFEEYISEWRQSMIDHISIIATSKYYSKIKAFIILSELAERLNCGIEGRFCVYYDGEELKVGNYDEGQCSSIKFATEELAEKAIELGGDLWYDLFGINK